MVGDGRFPCIPMPPIPPFHPCNGIPSQNRKPNPEKETRSTPGSKEEKRRRSQRGASGQRQKFLWCFIDIKIKTLELLLWFICVVKITIVNPAHALLRLGFERTVQRVLFALPFGIIYYLLFYQVLPGYFIILLR